MSCLSGPATPVARDAASAERMTLGHSHPANEGPSAELAITVCFQSITLGYALAGEGARMADVSVHGVRLWRPGRRQPTAATVPFSRSPDPRPPSPAGPVLAGLESDWHRLDDLQWADPCAHRADHIVVGPTGVFVIDAKSWPGTIDIGPDTIRHNRHKRHEVLTDIASAAKAIRCLLEPVSARSTSDPTQSATTAGGDTRSSPTWRPRPRRSAACSSR